MGVVNTVDIQAKVVYAYSMMNQSTTNSRRRAVERAVKQSELKRAAVERTISERKLGITEARRSEYVLYATIGDPISL